MSQAELSLPLIDTEHHKITEWNLKSTFSSSAAGLCVVLLGCFLALTDYAETGDAHVDQYYTWYIHVAVMIFVGFGFLMTFLKRYSFSAVGLNFLLSCVVMLEGVLVIGALQQGLLAGKASVIRIDLPLLIDAAFCAGAAMISFGAVLGKATPAELLWLVALETPIYALNAHFAERLKALDIGGSITIHAFGAYFGLAASMFISKHGSGSTHHKNAAVQTSDMTAMIGTIFLWIFWPSFNGALASRPDHPAESQFQLHCLINTIISLLGACVAAFAASSGLKGKFDMVHIQNATLAGGVAVGSAANLRIGPGGALAVGLAAGTLSTLGYVFITPLLEKKMNLRDTCGVHNLHGMPGVMGGVVAALVAWVGYERNSHVLKHGRATPLYQLAALGLTLAIALVGGAACGFVVDRVSITGQTLGSEHMFEDELFWEAEAEEED